MPITVNDQTESSPARKQIISCQQIGNNIDGTITVAVAAAGAGTGEFHGSPFAKGNGRITRVFAGNMTTALIGDATHDVIPVRFTPSWGEVPAAISRVPVLVKTAALFGIRLTVADVAGKFQEITALDETEYISVLQAPALANQIKLDAGVATAQSGFFCDADVEIIGGTGRGQKNRLKTYDGSTKIAKVVNAEGTANWKVATVAGSVARLRTRRLVVKKNDWFGFIMDFTVGTGTAGVDCIAGVEITFDDDAKV